MSHEELRKLESLQRLIIKMKNVLEIIYDSRREIRGELLLYYSLIYNAIYASIFYPNSETLNEASQRHTDKYRRRLIVEERVEAREWLMSEAPDLPWNIITSEDFDPIREQVSRLWKDMTTYCLLYPGLKTGPKLSRLVREQLQKGCSVR